MIYSIVVWGFDTDNDYQHDCYLIKAKSFKEAFEYTINYMWAGWTFTKIEIEILQENQYIIQYHDNYTNENDLFSCKADSELDAKIMKMPLKYLFEEMFLQTFKDIKY